MCLNNNEKSPSAEDRKYKIYIIVIFVVLNEGVFSSNVLALTFFDCGLFLSADSFCY